MSSLVAAVAVLQLVLSSDARTPQLPLAEITAAVQEVWQPYAHVIISEAGSMARIGAHVVELRISDVAPTRKSGEPSGALGWIDFVNGEPQPVITISPRRAEETVAKAVVFGRPSREWPGALARRMQAQALGRAIAHEIGHYLLRSASHSPRGLMRPEFTGQDFIERGPSRFQLTSSQQQQVRARLAAPLSARREDLEGPVTP